VFIIQEDYLNKMRLRNIIFNILIFFALALLAACTKTSITPPIQFQKQLLSGTGSFQNTQHIWQLDSTKIDGNNLTLTPTQKNYKKTFTFDGGYSDSDNNIGKWEITTINKLKQTIIYQSISKQDSIVYDIISINAAQMNLSLKLSNGQTAIYSFKISN
jgi:hypothetical protein